MIDEKVGDYKVISSLGKGGFGSVYKAQSESGQIVAIKVLNPQALDNERVVKKFFHEAMILAKLHHPNITQLLEFFPDGQNYAIVMEFVQGTELKKIMQQHKGPLPFETAYKIANQSLDAFQYAYENGILHRDIKPGNIILAEDGNCKLMDFGIAKMSSAASHDTAASMLSVHYVPPERFDRTREVDVRSDIYSLGLVLYELFAGRRPFSATETSQIMFAHLNEIPDPPEMFSPALPKQISEAIQKALEKDPDDRFQNFSDFKKAIQIEQEEFDDATAVMESDEYLEKTIMLVEEAEKKEKKVKKKKKSKTGLVVAVLAFVLIGGGVGGYFAFKPKREPPVPVAPAPAPAPVPVPTGPVTPDKPEGIEATLNAKNFWEVVHPADQAVMVHIPAGIFTMGSEQYSAEKPVQQISLDAFFIDKYLVTNEMFGKFVDATGYVTDAEKDGAGLVRIGRRWKKVDGASWKLPDGLTPIEGREDHPVSQVSFNDARAYCQWAQKDLPTEAQWEKAARGPEGNRFPWGDDEPDATMANFDNIVGSTSPVKDFEKGQSPFGLQDMAGNVYQWTRDWYATGARAAENPAGPAEGSERVIKGGSFIEGIESIRSANRDRYEPAYSSFLFGFRCATEEMPGQ